MDLIKNFLKNLFRKSKIKYIEEPKKNKTTYNFPISPKNSSTSYEINRDPECNDGNGYKIAPYTKLEDML